MCGIEAETLGVIAGNGPLPGIVLKNLKAEGLRLFVVAHVGETSEEDLALADTACWVKPGQLGTLLEFFKAHGVHRALFAGGMNKAALVRTFEPDKDALKFIETLPNLHDDTILRALAVWLEQKGVHVLDTRIGMGSLLAPEGVLTKSGPSLKHRKDIALGFQAARALGGLDIGQAVVVEDQLVLALEAIEGTDAMIHRAGAFSKGDGVLVKAKKPAQDPRFDLPSIGPRTIASMAKAGLKVLAFEAGWTVLFEQERLIAEADALGMVVVGVGPNGS